MFFQSLNRVKRSVDLNEETDFYIERYRDLLKQKGLAASRGAAMDSILTPILSLSPVKAAKLKQIVTRELKTEQSILDATPAADVFSRNERTREISALNGIANILDVLSDGAVPEQPMKKISMADGLALLIPDDSQNWVVANEADAPLSDKATIVEVRNGEKFGMPHFVVFHSGNATTEFIDETIASVHPTYRSVLAKRVEPRYDVDGNLLNAEEWDASPAIGRFPALPNNPVMGNPYGVEIINEGRKGAKI